MAATVVELVLAPSELRHSKTTPELGVTNMAANAPLAAELSRNIGPAFADALELLKDVTWAVISPFPLKFS